MVEDERKEKSPPEEGRTEGAAAGRAPAGGFEPEPEFEDEPPGAYLEELVLGRWAVVWGGLTLGCTAGLGLTGLLGLISPESSWRPLAKFLWAIVPPSAILLLVVTAGAAVARGGTGFGGNPAAGCLLLLLSLALLGAAWAASRVAAWLFFIAWVLFAAAGISFVRSLGGDELPERHRVRLAGGLAVVSLAVWLLLRFPLGVVY